MTRLSINNLFSKYVYQIAELLPEPLIRPNAVQAGVSLEDVKVGIHRLLLILILLT